MPSPWFITFLLALPAAILYVAWFFKSRPPYPPGPPPDFLWGNLKHIPRGGAEWESYNKLGHTYGRDFGGVFFRIFSSRLLVVNSYETARDLLFGRGSTYSSRPRMTMLKEVKRFDWNLVVMSYGKKFQAFRRLVQQEFQPSMVAEHYRPIITREVTSLLARLMADDAAIAKQLKWMAGAVIMMVAYGHQVVSADDEFVGIAEAVRERNEKRPGNNLVDFFPIMKYLPAWFPGGGFQKEAAIVRELSLSMRSKPYKAAQARFESGEARSSMVTRLAESEDLPNDFDRDEVVQDVTAVVYSAGADTTVAALLNFVHAMTLYPRVQETAQAQIDAMVGRDRLPTIDDRAEMPYVDNVVKEVLRWRAVSPLAVPHYTTADDVYRGAFIPKGTSVVANLWAMLHDETMYKNPDVFDPDRYACEPRGPLEEPDPALMAYGFGRRICPGRFFADGTLWLTISSLLHVFTISLPQGVTPEDVNVKWSSGLVSLPSDFPYVLTPRFPGARELVESLEADLGQ